jgi:hypothetical protein
MGASEAPFEASGGGSQRTSFETFKKAFQTRFDDVFNEKRGFGRKTKNTFSKLFF